MIERLLPWRRRGEAVPAEAPVEREGRLRVLVIGNSHVASLRGGWTKIERRHPDVTVDFFAVSKAHIAALELTEGRRYGVFGKKGARAAGARQTLRKFGLPEHVGLEDWDIVLWAGRFWPWRAVADLLLSYDVDGIRETDATARLSATAFRQVCDALAERSLPDPAWRRWTRPVLVYVPAPMAALDPSDSDGERAWQAILQRPDGFAAANSLLLDRMERVFAREGIRLLRQPRETIAATGVTHDRYTRGSPRLVGEGQHGTRDRLHMNEEYGALCLEAFLATATRPHAARVAKDH